VKARIDVRKQELRREKILEEIIRNPGVMIRDLAAKLDVSRETIRRDFDALSSSGQLQRRYGGATVVPAGNILSFEARQDKHIGERTLIARKAHGLLEDDQTVMLAPGTTALLFAQ
jgi:DeoR/GlpR family transcriptional regulator of sugar metabolism